MPTEQPTVLFLGPDWLVEVAERALGSMAVHHADSVAAAEAALPDCDAVLDASMAVPFPASRLDLAPRLRVFVTATTGADHVDAAALEARGIPLLTLRGQTKVLRLLTPAAEHSWLLLLACARGLPAAIDQVRAGGWDRTRHPGVMLRGRTLGIVGCGRIGQWMARYGAAFGMRCVGYDAAPESVPPEIEMLALNDLLAVADFVSVHVPLDETTKGLLDRERIDRMKSGAVLVNTSRGEVVDESALVDALERGHLLGVGVDVLTGEPDVEGNPLVELSRTHPNVVVTPHIGGFSPDALQTVIEFSCGRVAEHLGAR